MEKGIPIAAIAGLGGFGYGVYKFVNWFMKEHDKQLEEGEKRRLQRRGHGAGHVPGHGHGDGPAYQRGSGHDGRYGAGAARGLRDRKRER